MLNLHAKKRLKRLTYQAFFTFAQNTRFSLKTACFHPVHFCNFTKFVCPISTKDCVKKLSIIQFFEQYISCLSNT